MDFESETFIGFADAGYFGAMKEVGVSDPLRAKGGDTGNGGETLICGTLCNSGKAAGSATQQDAENGLLVAHTLRGEGFDASEDGTGRGIPLVPVAFSCKDYGADAGETSPTLRAMSSVGSHANGGGQLAVAFAENSRGELRLEGGNGGKPTQGIPVVFMAGQGAAAGSVAASEHTCPTLRSGDSGTNRTPSLPIGSAVRRLTPREYERLQDFPDDYTLIPGWQKIKKVRPEKLDHDYLKYLARGGVLTYEECIKAATDGPRYKALGNSMNTGCMKWLGNRIKQVETLMQGEGEKMGGMQR
jgi:DNA (cytosine-5)-methyltransferase 1